MFLGQSFHLYQFKSDKILKKVYFVCVYPVYWGIPDFSEYI